MQTNKWYDLDIAETIRTLNTGKEGLTAEEAASRLAQYGPNELTQEKKM